MTPEAQALVELAKKLTFVEQCFLQEGRVRMAFPFEVKARDRLVAKGLVRRGWFGYRWTPPGLAMREYLTRDARALASLEKLA